MRASSFKKPLHRTNIYIIFSTEQHFKNFFPHPHNICDFFSYIKYSSQMILSTVSTHPKSKQKYWFSHQNHTSHSDI